MRHRVQLVIGKKRSIDITLSCNINLIVTTSESKMTKTGFALNTKVLKVKSKRDKTTINGLIRKNIII